MESPKKYPNLNAACVLTSDDGVSEKGLKKDKLRNVCYEMIFPHCVSGEERR